MRSTLLLPTNGEENVNFTVNISLEVYVIKAGSFFRLIFPMIAQMSISKEFFWHSLFSRWPQAQSKRH